MTMIAAFKFDNLVAPGIASRQSNGGHDRFGTRGNKAYFLYKTVSFEDEFGQLIFQRRWSTKTQAPAQRIHNFFTDGRVIVAQYQWPPGTAKINKLIAIGIPQMASIPFFNKEGHAMNGFESPHR